MRSALLVISLIAVTALASCSEDEPQDPFIGDWNYQSTMVQSKFTITVNPQSSGRPYYVLTDFELKMNGVMVENPEFLVRRPTPGKLIEEFWLVSDVDSIGFINIRPSGNKLIMDSAVYMPGVVVYKNQALTRK